MTGRNRSPPKNSSHTSQQAIKIASHIKRSKHLKNLKIEFDEDTVNRFTPLLFELEKDPHRLSSFQNITLAYEGYKDQDLSKFSNSLAGLKETTASITHISISAQINKAASIDFANFRKLNSLSIRLNFFQKNCIAGLLSLGALTSLETFQFAFGTQTPDQMEDVLMNFIPPKSIKTLILELNLRHWEEFLNGSQKLSSQDRSLEPPIEKFFEEEWIAAKEFYERWSHVDKLSNLDLTFEGNGEYDYANFFFVIPILKRCHHLKSLVLRVAEHKKFLHWSHIFRALKPSKDTMEEINIENCYFNP